MGCILFPFELIFEGIIEGWFYLMQWFVPERVLRKGFRTALKIIVGIFTIILFLFMFLGIFALLSDDEYTNYMGCTNYFGNNCSLYYEEKMMYAKPPKINSYPNEILYLKLYGYLQK